MENKEHIRELHKLMQVCEDGAKGYRNAADNIDHSDIKSLLYKIAAERTKFIGELQDDVRQLGGEPERVGSITGTLHRIFTNFRAAVSGLENKTVLKECERGETAAIAAYEKMLQTDLPDFIKQRLSAQHESIMKACGEVEALEKKLQD